MKRAAGTRYKMRKGGLDLLDGMTTTHYLFFFEDIVIIPNFKSWYCKVVVQILFTPRGILILEYNKEK